MQVTTKYKIPTKYQDILDQISIAKARSQNMCNQKPMHKDKRRKTNIVYKTKVWATRKPVTNGIGRKAFRSVLLVTSRMLFIPKTGQKPHMIKRHPRRKTRTDLHSVQSEHISVYSWHITNWRMVILQIYNWRPILYNKRKPLVQ